MYDNNNFFQTNSKTKICLSIAKIDKSKLLKTKPVSNYCFCFERVSESTLSRYGTTNLYDFSKKQKIGLLLLYFFSNSYLEVVKLIDIYISVWS